MGRIGRKQSLRLMEVAFDAGIRHFDTAPLYGLGAAEAMVGEFAAKKRADITIATKFGIRPPPRSSWMSVAKAGARLAIKVAPSLRANFRRRVEAQTARCAFTPAECRESLAMSLQQLKTGRIDFFLLHEVLPDQITADLMRTLRDAVKEGSIERYGIATTADAAVSIARNLPRETVAQFPSSVFHPTAARIPGHLIKITHSALGAQFKTLCDSLGADQTMLRTWSAALDLDCSDHNQVGRLLLYAAMVENRDGTVVFSSLNEKRIRSNAALMAKSPFSLAQLELLQNLMEEAQWFPPRAS